MKIIVIFLFVTAFTVLVTGIEETISTDTFDDEIESTEKLHHNLETYDKTEGYDSEDDQDTHPHLDNVKSKTKSAKHGNQLKELATNMYTDQMKHHEAESLNSYLQNLNRRGPKQVINKVVEEKYMGEGEVDEGNQESDKDNKKENLTNNLVQSDVVLVVIPIPIPYVLPQSKGSCDHCSLKVNESVEDALLKRKDFSKLLLKILKGKK